MGFHVLFVGFHVIQATTMCKCYLCLHRWFNQWGLECQDRSKWQIWNKWAKITQFWPRPCVFHITCYWISVNYGAQHLQSIQPHNKTYRPQQHVGCTQPVDTDSVPTHRTVRHDGFSLQAVAKETGKVAGLIGLYKNHAHVGDFIKVELPRPMRMR